MTKTLKRPIETRTGIRVVHDGDVVETFNVVGERIHRIEKPGRIPGVFVARWYGTPLDEEMKEIIGGHFYDVFLECGGPLCLIDIRDCKSSWDGINDWQRDEIMPKAYAAGLKRVATLLPREAAPGAEQVVENHEFAASRFAEDDAHIAAFFSEEEALAWLRRAHPPGAA
ncbi:MULTISPECIES: hypothetical protein [Sorangium]|uniref:STAS/SEC14 domain-containing protein n=1 Tax=Sorangium atrum TaxID=2995308 RepID=A0ABT5BTI3_9BACT|nr:hypothetical protein [Sorangium aterium]MDC0676282.1 hypothetical protein [Sorangium aterium]